MARTIEGTGRVTVLPLLHLWPDGYCVLAYTATGALGDTAVVGYVPVPGIPDVSLMDVAARHEPQRLYGSSNGSDFAEARWLICTGWSGRGMPKPGTLELKAAAWQLDVDRTVELGKTMYGYDRLHVGRLTLDDAEQLHQAQDLLAARA
ncbi:hypothetical protein V1460_02370 [Streptomyces sp. SCSIO 30461]|uniref:hypothetical protein n=1 Tax=Streptomyces sp. SCSIO 30461 TaxID=3118085 RepID=UPI0030CD66E6